MGKRSNLDRDRGLGLGTGSDASSPLRCLLVLLALSAGCGLLACSAPESPPSDSGHLGATCLPGCPGTRDYDAQAYELVGEFDWKQRLLSVREQISLLVPGPPGVVELDAEVFVTRVSSGDTMLPFVYDDTANTLRVDLSPLHPSAGMVTFTVEYHTGTSPGMIASSGRDADPVTSRVVFTYSEPDRGRYWLVANHRPTDRARWAVELTVAADEDVIANGTRIKDEQRPQGRVVRYQIDQPLPTYLMAFAAGQIVHHDRTGGRVPLSLWYRRGLTVVPDQNLDAVASAMATFEALLGPYPWDRYSVVLLPEIPSAVEHATITFNTESLGQGAVNFTVNAHELAHHWFGDWVTVATFDDVWIKEGMATLLESEASRATRDTQAQGRLFGSDYYASHAAAIRDRSLTGSAKYTSGPYGRAAWLLTQIRAMTGDGAFFGSLRGVLSAHALGSIDSEAFVRSFAPALDEQTIAKVLAALDGKPVPALTLGVQPAGTDTVVTMTLSDSAGALIAPLRVTVVDAAGQATVQPLKVSVPLQLTVPKGGYLAPDEEDVHPDWLSAFAVDKTAYYQRFAPLFVPSTAPALAAFLRRSTAHQERTLNRFGLPPLAPAELTDFAGGLGSILARQLVEVDGCRTLAQVTRSGGDVMGWTAALSSLLKGSASLSTNTGYAACGTMLPTAAFGAEFSRLAGALDAASAGRFNHLLSFDYGAATSFSVLSLVATTAPSLQLRQNAVWRLSNQATSTTYSAVPVDQQTQWRQFFRDRLTEATSESFFSAVWQGLSGLADDSSLALVGKKLGTISLASSTQEQVVCGAYRIAQARAGAWLEFQQAAQPWSKLAPQAIALLMDPTKCP